MDHADAFRVVVAESTPLDALVRAVFSSAPAWVERMLRLRNALVKPLGLKTDPGAAADAQSGPVVPGGHVGFFRVYARSENEVLLGEDDRHLDFRVSVRLQRESAACWAVVTTVVCFHNWVGRAYFLPVKPFHRIIVPALLEQGVRRLSPS
ncbi:MAG: DUF2867 domain-containing protein [Myxococcota bacterium]